MRDRPGTGRRRPEARRDAPQGKRGAAPFQRPTAQGGEGFQCRQRHQQAQGGHRRRNDLPLHEERDSHQRAGKRERAARASTAPAVTSRRFSASSARAMRASSRAMAARCAASRPVMARSVWPATRSMARDRRASTPRARRWAAGAARRATMSGKPRPATARIAVTPSASAPLTRPSVTPPPPARRARPPAARGCADRGIPARRYPP